MEEFPKWMYHRTEAAVIVDDPAEQDALGKKWAETPAAFGSHDKDEVEDAIDEALNTRSRRKG